MLPTLLPLLLTLVPLIGAQTATTPSSSSTSSTPTTLPSLLAAFPHCALGCLAKAASSLTCSPTDFACLCDHSSDLVSAVAPCIISASGCSADDINQIRKLAPDLCPTVKSDTVSSDVAAASSYVSAALATVTGTPSATASPNAAAAKPRGAARPRGAAALGVMGMGIAVIGAMGMGMVGWEL